MSKSLDEIFTAEPQEEVQQVVETPATQEAEPVVETTETVETVESVDTMNVSETPDSSDTEAEEPKTVPQQALHEERSKRQEADKSRLDLEKRFNALTEQVGQLLPHLSRLGGKEPVEKPKLDFYADPQAFISENLTNLESRINQSLGSTLMTMSEQQARARHEDYDATLETFAALTQQRPEILAQVRQVPDPAGWAYNFVKKHEALQAIGDDPIAFEKSLREKILAEQEAKPETPETPNLPKSLANARNVGAGKRTSGPGWQGPTSLDAALAGAPGRAKK